MIIPSAHDSVAAGLNVPGMGPPMSEPQATRSTSADPCEHMPRKPLRSTVNVIGSIVSRAPIPGKVAQLRRGATEATVYASPR